MVDDPLKQLGDIFKKARLQSGYTVEDLADRCRIAARHIENIEKANRADLPEEAYLMSFLSKIARTLKLKNPEAAIEAYKSGEGDYIVQNILNENHVKDEPKAFGVSFIKIYHLYIIIALLFIAGIYYLFNSGENTETTEPELITLSKLDAESSKKIETKAEDKEFTDFNQKDKIAEDLDDQSNPNAIGSGRYSLKLKIREVAWFQVYGIAAEKVLYEGDAYPNVKPNEFEFRDDIGFSLASGNAAAFEVHDADKSYILGESGQLIKWYYPDNAKYEYKQRLAKN